METITNVALVNGAILGFRVALLGVLAAIIISLTGLIVNRVRYELDKIEADEPLALLPKKLVWPVSIRIGLIALVGGVMLWTFQASPYVPKARVVESTSTVAAQAEADRTVDKLAEGVKESEADAKAKARKSEIDIRQKYEALPDK